MESTDILKKVPGRQSSFGERLKWVRRKLDLSVIDLSLKLQCDRSYIYRLEAGLSRNPSLNFLEDVCDGLNVNRIWLENGDGDPFVAQETLELRSVARETGLIEPPNSLRGDEAELVKLSEFLFSKWTINEFVEFLKFALEGIETKPPAIRSVMVLVARLATREMGKRAVKNVAGKEVAQPKVK